MTVWLYKRIMVCGITLAAIVWWDRMEIALARSELGRLQRAACVMITRPIRTTSTKKKVRDAYRPATTYQIGLSQIIVMLCKYVHHSNPAVSFLDL